MAGKSLPWMWLTSWSRVYACTPSFPFAFWFFVWINQFYSIRSSRNLCASEAEKRSLRGSRTTGNPPSTAVNHHYQYDRIRIRFIRNERERERTREGQIGKARIFNELSSFSVQLLSCLLQNSVIWSFFIYSFLFGRISKYILFSFPIFIWNTDFSRLIVSVSIWLFNFLQD